MSNKPGDIGYCTTNSWDSYHCPMGFHTYPSTGVNVPSSMVEKPTLQEGASFWEKFMLSIPGTTNTPEQSMSPHLKDGLIIEGQKQEEQPKQKAWDYWSAWGITIGLVIITIMKEGK